MTGPSIRSNNDSHAQGGCTRLDSPQVSDTNFIGAKKSIRPKVTQHKTDVDEIIDTLSTPSALEIQEFCNHIRKIMFEVKHQNPSFVL